MDGMHRCAEVIFFCGRCPLRRPVQWSPAPRPALPAIIAVPEPKARTARADQIALLPHVPCGVPARVAYVLLFTWFLCTEDSLLLGPYPEAGRAHRGRFIMPQIDKGGFRRISPMETGKAGKSVRTGGSVLFLVGPEPHPGRLIPARERSRRRRPCSSIS